MTETFDIEHLKSRINKIKKDGEDSTEFTLEFLQCLMDRHNLSVSIPPNFSDPNIPQIIFDTLSVGEIPTKDQVLLMDTETQDHLIALLIWLCGMYAICLYVVDDLDFIDHILAMLDVSAGHFIGCYLYAVYTLLMGAVPSENIISVLTNDFDSSPEALSRSQDIFLETAYNLLLRWREDKSFYTTTNSSEEI